MWSIIKGTRTSLRLKFQVSNAFLEPNDREGQARRPVPLTFYGDAIWKRALGLFFRIAALNYKMLIVYVRKMLMEAAVMLFLLTVSPVYAMSEIESRKAGTRPAQVQMISVRSRRRALDRRINPYAPVGFYPATSFIYINYGNRDNFVPA